jgi:hypothetical protein
MAAATFSLAPSGGGIPIQGGSGSIQGGNIPVNTTSANATISVPSSKSSSSAPAAQPNSNVNSGIYSGSGSDTTTAQNVAAYQDQINALNQLLSNANVNQTNGTNAINTGYNNAEAQLEGNNANVLAGYGTQKTQTTGNYSSALNTINSNARNGYNSLESLLGGSGSAGDILAPFAVSNAANTQRGASSQAYAQNLQAIQDGINAANLNFNNQKQTLVGQKNTQLQNLLDSIAQQKIQYQQQLGADQNQIRIAQGGSYQTPVAANNAITALIQQQQGDAANFAQPSFTVQDYTAPTTNLAGYQSEAAALAGNGSADTSQSDPSAALGSLLKFTASTNQYAY